MERSGKPVPVSPCASQSPVSAQPAGSGSYYDAYWQGCGGWRPPHGLDPELRAWLEPMIFPGATMLDVGCGDGSHYADYLIGRGVQLEGVDVSAVAVRAAQARGIQAQTVNLANPLPYPDCRFHAVTCLEVLEHLLDPELVAAEMLRVLRAGGRCLVSVPNVGFWTVRLELLVAGHFNPKGSPLTQRQAPWRDPHIRFFNQRSLRRLLESVGFRIDRAGGLETQFLDVAGLAPALAWSPLGPLRTALRHAGRWWPHLLARRCIVLAVKPA